MGMGSHGPWGIGPWAGRNDAVEAVVSLGELSVHSGQDSDLL